MTVKIPIDDGDIAAALSGAAKRYAGRFLLDLERREEYATDESLYRITPRAAFWPTSIDEVAEVLQLCRRLGVPLTCRGAGTSTAGQAIGSGMIVDFSRHMKRILDVNRGGARVDVEPGIIYEELNRSLAAAQLFFPVNPSSGARCTIGGMLANNASGPYSFKYGATKDNVLNLHVLLADGRVIETANPPNDLVARLQEVGTDFRSEIERYRPRTVVNSSGYNVWDAFQKEEVNLLPLLIGSEGTLGIIFHAGLRLAPIPHQRAAALMGFNDLDTCSRAVQTLRPLSPCALEILDQELIQAMRTAQPEDAELIPVGIDTLLIVEFDSNQHSPVDESLTQAEHLTKTITSIFMRLGDAERFWKLRKDASPILHRTTQRGEKPLRFIEDGAVAPEKLPHYLRGLKDILKRHGTTGAAFGHAGNGHIHINPRLNPTVSADRQKLRDIMREQTALLLDLQGTASGEHGDGLLRTAVVRAQYGPLVAAFEKIKEIFDPEHVLNPGKILNADPEAPFRNWRF